MTLSLDGRWRLRAGKGNGGGGNVSGNDFRERIDRILDAANVEDLKAIYYLLLSRTGVVLDSDCWRKE